MCLYSRSTEMYENIIGLLGTTENERLENAASNCRARKCTTGDCRIKIAALEFAGLEKAGRKLYGIPCVV